jgi:preprotein translocase subunit SecD
VSFTVMIAVHRDVLPPVLGMRHLVGINLRGGYDAVLEFDNPVSFEGTVDEVRQRTRSHVFSAAHSHNGFRDAAMLRYTPFKTGTEWGQARVAAIPEDRRCEKCAGTGNDVILASNGGVGEVVICWPCEGTGRKKA